MNLLRVYPWRRAPGLLLRRPIVFLAVALASAVLTVAAASGVLFLSTVGSAAVHAQAAADCPEAALPGATALIAPSRAAGLASTSTSGREQFRAAGLPGSYSVAFASTDVVGTNAVLLSRSGALDHVVRLSGRLGQAGIWIPDDLAAREHLRAGATIRLPAGPLVRVAGIYRSLAPSPFSLSHLPRYWCNWHDLIVPDISDHSAGPLLLTDDATLAAATSGPVVVSWYAPVINALSLPAMRARLRQAAAAVRALHGVNARLNPDLGAQLGAAGATQSGVGGAVLPIDIAGVLVAALLMAGSGVYWATYRAGEIRLLVSRGVGPGGLALKAVLETAPPALIGLVCGYAAALILVRGAGVMRGLGPSRVLEPHAAIEAMAVAAGAVTAGLLIVAAIGAWAVQERQIGRGWAARVPWELALVAVALAVGNSLRFGPAARLDHGVIRIRPATFVFALLAAAAAVAVLARVGALLLPRLARRQRRGIAGFLAVHRLAGSRGVTISLLVGIALPIALLNYADALSKGISANVTAKSRTSIGADHVVEVIGPYTRAPHVRGHGTVVVDIQLSAVLKDGSQVEILGVDPATFATVAHTNTAQRRDVARLMVASGQGVVPTLVVNGGGIDPQSVRIGSSTLRLKTLARTAVFPGLRNRYQPLLVLDRRTLTHLDGDVDASTQIWTTDAQYSAALRALAADKDYSILVDLTGGVIVGNTGLLPLTWMFGYLTALAVLIGLVAVVALVFALAARTRRRTVSYVLSRRMGLRLSTHLWSLFIELSLVVGTGWIFGSLIGLGSAAAVTRQLDVYPNLLPSPTIRVSTNVLVSTAVAAVVVVSAALASQALAQRTRAGDVLRRG